MSGMVALRCPECRARSYQEAARVAIARNHTGAWNAVQRTSRLDTDMTVDCSFCGSPALGDSFPLVPLRGVPGSADPVIERCAACAVPVLVTGRDHMGAVCVECRPVADAPTEGPLPEICAQWYVGPLRGPMAVVEARAGAHRFHVKYPLQPELEMQRGCQWVDGTDHAVCGRPMRFVRAVALHERWNLTCPDCIAGRRVTWPPLDVRERARVALRCVDCGAPSTRDAARLGFGYHQGPENRLIACVRVTGKLLRCKRCSGLLTPENREE